MKTTANYPDALAASVSDPTPENLRRLLDVAVLERTGIHQASKDRQALQALIDAPDEKGLAELGKSEQDAADRLKAARESLDAAGLAVDEAQAVYVAAHQENIVGRNNAADARRALETPIIAQVWRDHFAKKK